MAAKKAKAGAKKGGAKKGGAKTPSTRPGASKAGASKKRKTAKGSGSSPKRKSTKARKRPARSRWQKTARWLTLLFFLGSAGLLLFVAVLSYFARDLPTVDSIRKYNPPQITRVLDRKGRLISELFEERRTVVPMERIPRVLVLSVLAAEDADFYRHQGLDYAGILRALIRDVTSGSARQGASTITQQIVKNLLLTPERTIQRKVRELILARRLEQELDKNEILHLYLNHIYFGHGRYGVQEASRYYFGKDVDKLSLAEASLIAGIPQAPSRLSPIRHPKAAGKRQRYVLDQLERKRAQYWSDLSLETIEAARTTEVKLVGGAAKKATAPEAVIVARALLKELVGADAARRGGFTIETSIDAELQQQARKALRKGLAAIDGRHKRMAPFRAAKKRRKAVAVKRLQLGRHYDATVTGSDDGAAELSLSVGGHRVVASIRDGARHNPKGLKASRFAEKGARLRVSITETAHKGGTARARLELGPQGAVVVIDPRSRDVLALVGGDTAGYGFNRALSAVRQPGSTFKPISYGLAIANKRYTPASLVLDAPEVFDKWKPQNYETWNYAGAVRLREALARSINLVAVRVMSDLTPERVVDFAHSLGIRSKLEPTLALALGASGVTPLELTNAYATFAAGGRFAPSRIIKRVLDGNGEAIPLPAAETPRNVMTPAAAYVLTSMLTSVVTDGTGKAALELQRPAAGKTGTSNQARDGWFVGYTPEIVAGVWVGYDDHRSLGRREGGGKSALPVWVEVLLAYLKGKPVVDFPRPPGVVTASIDPQSGLLAYEGMDEALQEVFLEGTVPTQSATPPDVVEVDQFLMEQFAAPDSGLR